jgi:hypothetical protein
LAFASSVCAIAGLAPTSTRKLSSCVFTNKYKVVSPPLC